MEKTPGSSAALLAFGFIATALGGVLEVVGVMMNAAEVVSKYGTVTSPGLGWVVFGMVLGAAGVIGLAAGFYKLAAAVDHLVAQSQRTGRLPAS